MAKLSVTEERPRERRRFGETNRRTFKNPEASKRGTSGTPVKILTNYFQVTKLPNFAGLYQYVCAFDPDVQSQKLKGFLMFKLQDVIGDVRVFDGMTLFLPKKVDDFEQSVETRDGSCIKVKVTFTNDVPVNSPQVVQLMGILFRR